MLRLTRLINVQRQCQRVFTAKSCRRLLSSSESDATSSITSDSRVGLLMDMDNLLIPDNEGQFEDTDVLKAVLKESQKYGRVVVRKAYMDSNQWSSIRQELAARAIEIVDMPILNHHSQKNSADIKLSLDALCLSMEDVCDTFVIASGDSDFTPLCQKLREQNKTTVVVSRFGTTSKVLANFADHATTVDDLILCRPLDWHDCEPVLKAAMILSCGLQGDDAWVSTSRVSSLIKQLPQSHKQQTLRLKTLLRRSDVDKYFKIKKEDDGAQIHMRPLSKSESTHDRKIEFTEYENSLLLQEVLHNRLDIKVWRDPVVLGHALRLVYDELSSSEDTMMDINDVANEVREKLHGKSMSIARHRSRRLVQLLESIGILETVSSSECETDSIREIVSDDDDSKSEDMAEDEEKEEQEEDETKRKSVVRISKVIDSSTFSSFRTAIDSAIVQNIRTIVEGDGYSVSAQDFHTILYGPGLNVNGKEIPMPKTRQGEFVEMLESKDLTMYRIERILEGEDPTELPAVSDDNGVVDEKETKISFLSRLRRRWSGS